MSWRLLTLFAVLILNFDFIGNEEKNDKESKDTFLCTSSKSCQYYQEQVKEIRNAERVETKNEILFTLR